ncbi:hypothetical protein [Campylobacter sp. RM16192]|uniref:hypothetical protein n=1 Tax=Campylobacter sp. RM16192 TaxID=1660080 RepID=UPI001555E9FA|nr:hypothetical protein [Campylobacter sp. RM16192]
MTFNTRDFREVSGSDFSDTTSTSAPIVTFIADVNNDGFLNKNENDSDKNKDQTSVKITVPSDAEVGDTLNM